MYPQEVGLTSWQKVESCSMAMKKCNCALCNTPVIILDGMTEAACSKCGNIVRLDDIRQKQRRRISRSKYQLILLVLLLAVMGGVWAYVGTRDSGGPQSSGVYQSASKWIEYIGGEPRATDVTPSQFYLWEFHSDDTVRQVRMVSRPNISGRQIAIGGPWLKSYDDILSFTLINGTLIDQTSQERDNRGVMNYCYSYYILANDDRYGFDILTNQGYLHVRETDRLLSIGADPQSYDAQYIHAIAISQTANVTSIYDSQPYRHIIVGEWDVFYYDITNISSHVSIHISYIPGEDAPELDWAEVEAAR
jgi:hypothetical protein